MSSAAYAIHAIKIQALAGRRASRTRRRAASRPAGPPSAGGVEQVPIGTLDSAGAGDGEPADDGHHVEHVPIKKKGTRKR